MKYLCFGHYRPNHECIYGVEAMNPQCLSCRNQLKGGLMKSGNILIEKLANDMWLEALREAVERCNKLARNTVFQCVRLDTVYREVLCKER